MNVPIEWLGIAITALWGAILTLVVTLWKFVNQKFKDQNRVIGKLQRDVERLSLGCGMSNCLWKRAAKNTQPVAVKKGENY